MNISQLESFLWVARLGSVTEACNRLNVTQSTLSMRLKALEDDLGIPLFERAHKQLRLTAKGRDLIGYAEKIVKTVKDVQLHVADSAVHVGKLRVGMAELIALSWGPTLVRQFRSQFPKVLVDLDVGAPRPMTDGLVRGDYDVVLAPLSGHADASGPGIALGSVPFSWVASPELSIAPGKKTVNPHDLEDHSIIGVARTQSVIHWFIQQWFADEGASLSRYNVCNSLTIGVSLVMEGLGVGLFPDVYCAPYVEAGKLRVLRARRRFALSFYALWSGVGDQVLPRKMAELAGSVSTFPNGEARLSRKAGGPGPSRRRVTGRRRDT